MNKVTRHFCWHQNFVPWGLSTLRWAIYMYKVMKKKCIKSDFKEIFWNLQQMTEVTRCCCRHQNFVSKGLSAPALWAIYMYKSMKKKCIKSDFKEISLKLVANDRSDKMFLLTSNFCPLCLSGPTSGLYTCIKLWKTLYKIGLQRDFFKLVANDRSDKRFLLTSKFCPLGLSALDLWLYAFIKSWKKNA